MTASKTVEPALVAPEVSEPLGCLVVKTQLCGKKCKCIRLNERHGPYAWLVSYVPKGKKKDGKEYVSLQEGEKYVAYKWEYLGKPGKPEKAFAKLAKYATNETNYKILEGKLKGFFECYIQDEAFRKKILESPKTDIT